MSSRENNLQVEYDKVALFFLSRDQCEQAYRVWRHVHQMRLQHAQIPSTFDVCWCDSLDLIGLKLYLLNRPLTAELYFRESLAEKERALPPAHPEHWRVHKSVVHIARSLAAQHKYSEAEDLFRRALGFYADTLGETHEDTLSTMNELASVLSQQEEKLDESEKLGRIVLTTRDRLWGSKHQETLESVWGLASILEKQNRSEDAMLLYKKAYEGASDVLGEQHCDTKDYLGDCLRLKGKL